MTPLVYHVDAIAELKNLQANLPPDVFEVIARVVASIGREKGEVDLAVVAQAVELLFPSTPRCDFCSDPEIVKSYECHPHVMEEHDLGDMLLVSHTNDPWAACAQCASLIDAGDLRGLVQRGFARYYELHPEQFGRYPAGELIAELERTYRRFFELRK